MITAEEAKKLTDERRGDMRPVFEKIQEAAVLRGVYGCYVKLREEQIKQLRLLNYVVEEAYLYNAKDRYKVSWGKDNFVIPPPPENIIDKMYGWSSWLCKKRKDQKL